jgi:site-specific DNA-methyltransferase (adenine-specific)
MLYNSDCFDILPTIENDCVDLILCDLPYAITALKWDEYVPLDKLWLEYKRILKSDGIVCLFGRQPFTSLLVMSNIDMYRYNWIWEKESPSDFLNVKYKPLNISEDIVVFSNNTVGSLSKNPIKYYPQGIVMVNKIKHNNPKSNWRKNKGYSIAKNSLNSDKKFVQNYENYPTNILYFSRDKDSFHPTQKPISLLK